MTWLLLFKPAVFICISFGFILSASKPYTINIFLSFLPYLPIICASFGSPWTSLFWNKTILELDWCVKKNKLYYVIYIIVFIFFGWCCYWDETTLFRAKYLKFEFLYYYRTKNPIPNLYKKNTHILHIICDISCIHRTKHATHKSPHTLTHTHTQR